MLSVAIFKLIQGSTHAPYLWLELKVTNNTFLTALVASLVMFQYPLALMILLMMVVMRFSYCLVPMPENYDFTWRSYAINGTFAVVWTILMAAGIGIVLIGTVLEQVNYEHSKMQEKVLEMA